MLLLETLLDQLSALVSNSIMLALPLLRGKDLHLQESKLPDQNRSSHLLLVDNRTNFHQLSSKPTLLQTLPLRLCQTLLLEFALLPLDNNRPLDLIHLPDLPPRLDLLLRKLLLLPSHLNQVSTKREWTRKMETRKMERSLGKSPS